MQDPKPLDKSLQDKIAEKTKKSPFDTFLERTERRIEATQEHWESIEQGDATGPESKHEKRGSAAKAVAGTVCSVLPFGGVVQGAFNAATDYVVGKLSGDEKERQVADMQKVTGGDTEEQGHLNTVMAHVAGEYSEAINAFSEAGQNIVGKPANHLASQLAKQMTDEIMEKVKAGDYKDLSGKELQDQLAADVEQAMQNQYQTMCKEYGIENPPPLTKNPEPPQQGQSQEQQQSHDMSRIPPGLLAEHGRGFTSCAQQANEGQHYGGGQTKESGLVR